MWCLFLIVFMWHITPTGLCTLKHSCLPGINLSWLWGMTFLMICWIVLISIFLRIFPFIFTEDWQLPAVLRQMEGTLTAGWIWPEGVGSLRLPIAFLTSTASLLGKITTRFPYVVYQWQEKQTRKCFFICLFSLSVVLLLLLMFFVFLALFDIVFMSVHLCQGVVLSVFFSSLHLSL